MLIALGCQLTEIETLILSLSKGLSESLDIVARRLMAHGSYLFGFGWLVGPRARGEGSDSEVPLPWIISVLPVVNRAGLPSHGVVQVTLEGGLRVVSQGTWEQFVKEDAGRADASHGGGEVLIRAADHG